MSDEPKQEWLDAANAAAERVFDSLGTMDDLDLGLHFVSPEKAKATNSADSSFLDYLAQGGHLKGSFLGSVS